MDVREIASKQQIDPYGRPVKSLRLSITQLCNFNCFFCHQEGEEKPGVEMTPDEIEKIVSIASELGVTRVKITGGEPLLRDDAVEIVRRISPYVEEVSMTTNGYKLAEMAYDLKEAGLTRVNVSFHSVKSDVFCKIIGKDAMQEVEKGILTAIEYELHPVKLNAVIINGINDGEIFDMIDFSKKIGATLQLIEYQPLERGAEEWPQYHVDLLPIEETLGSRAEKIVVREMHRRKRYFLKDGGVVEVVRPTHNSEFCKHCTRLRVTSDGCLKPCLMRNDNHINIASLIRKGADKNQLISAFQKAVSCREPYWEK
jgi:cyclic pyranopterin phosphate synthase